MDEIKNFKMILKKINSILAGILFSFCLFAQSPHGDQLKPDCGECHTSNDWNVELSKVKFDHNSTSFNLNGQHKNIDCRLCHTSLILSDVKENCSECHVDIHEQTVGDDCVQCHTTESWLIANVEGIHRMSRFPLLGTHAVTDCEKCHPSNSLLKFEPLGVDCYDCHQQSYLASTQPNHIEAGYSTDCLECHSPKSFVWSAEGFNHEFFPLTQGHSGVDCASCHGEAKYESVSTECYDCHKQDYDEAANPVHDPVVFSQQCTECHTTSPDWQPADYRIHDNNSFPIYSGKHRGEWKNCTECHTNTNDYTQFTCTDCHAHGKLITDLRHNEERDYVYESNACYECHPRGRAEDD